MTSCEVPRYSVAWLLFFRFEHDIIETGLNYFTWCAEKWPINGPGFTNKCTNAMAHGISSKPQQLDWQELRHVKFNDSGYIGRRRIFHAKKIYRVSEALVAHRPVDVVQKLPVTIGAIFRTLAIFSFTAITRTIRMTLNILAMSEQGTIGLPIGLSMSIIWTEPED